MDNELFESLVLELRRGTLVLSVLSQLHKPHYGYSLMQRLSEKGIEIQQNTLYPLLRRLEKQKLLSSDWEVGQSRPRRYYQLSDNGKVMFERLKNEWNQMVDNMNSILNEQEGE